MFKFLFKLKKPLFLTHFHNFGSKKCFSEKYGCHQKTPNEFPTPCQNSEKSNDPASRKQQDRRQDRRTDLISLGPFQLLWGVQQVQLLDNDI